MNTGKSWSRFYKTDRSTFVEFVLRLSHGPFLAQPNHGLIVITWALCYSCGHLSYCFCFFSFCAKPSADLGLVGLSLSLTTLAGLSDRLSKIPLGRERPQTAICCLEWLGRWKCLATGLDASLSFLSTSRRCSRNRSRLNEISGR